MVSEILTHTNMKLNTTHSHTSDIEGVQVLKILENPLQRGVQKLMKALQMSSAEE